METICFIILHYGDINVTDACVQSVLRLEGQEQIRILIADNDVDKPAPKRERLREKYKDAGSVKVLQIRENGGFSYANNQAYRYARENWKAGFILILNNDIVFPQRDFIRRLTEAYKASPCHILAPDIIRQGTGEHQNPLDTRLRTRSEAEYTVRMNRLALKLYPVVYPLLRLQQKKAAGMERARRTQSEPDGYVPLGMDSCASDEREQYTHPGAEIRLHTGQEGYVQSEMDGRMYTERQRRTGEREPFWKTEQENIVPFGACLIFTPLFIAREQIAFDPETRFFYEEYLLALRCSRKQYRILYSPSMRVHHESGTATKNSIRSERKRLRFILERTAEAAGVYLEELEK